jgi:phosphoglucomutase/phosphomannomutase
MATLRSKPPAACGGLAVVRTRDQANLTTWTPGAAPEPYAGVTSDLVIFDLAGLPDAGTRTAGRFPALGNAVAARPSGTEPKIKFYLFTAAEPCSAADLPAIKTARGERLGAMEADLRALVGV